MLNVKTSVGWNTIPLHHVCEISFVLAKWLQNMTKCQNTLTVLTLRWKIFLQDVRVGQMYMTDVGTTQDNFILPAHPVVGLPISQNWLDRMKRIHDHIIPIILPSGKNILTDMVLKITILQSRLGSRSAFSLPLMPTKYNVFINKI